MAKGVDSLVESADYDTSINVIGGLKDCSIIHQAITSFFDNGNAFDEKNTRLRTERSRMRIEHAVKEGFLKFHNQDHRDLIKSLFQNSAPGNELELVLYWQFALNNSLFRVVSSDLFMKTYFSGRTGIGKDDVVAYLKEIVPHDVEMKPKWSENTISTLATKYLNLLTKLNLIEGGRVKLFRYVKPTSEQIVIFLYFAKLFEPGNSDISTNGFLPLSFVPQEDFHRRLKRLSLKGLFNMDMNGVALKVELTYGYKEICDVLYG